MKYTIFQISSPKVPYEFFSWSFALDHKFDFRDYVGVYIGEMKSTDVHSALESIYTKFNIDRTEDFKGHSLSMSDIIKFEDDFGDVSYYYCDTIGWKDITSFIECKKEKRPHLHERAKLVRAMETVARAINNEDIFDSWLTVGVADGDIKDDTPDEYLEYYCSDESLSDLMGLFLRLMERAKKDGGIQCDGLVSAY